MGFRVSIKVPEALDEADTIISGEDTEKLFSSPAFQELKAREGRLESFLQFAEADAAKRRPKPTTGDVEELKKTLPKHNSSAADPLVSHLGFKTRMRYEKVARYTAAGLPDAQIADILGYAHASKISIIRATPEFKAIAASLSSGILSEMDEKLAESQIFQRQRMVHGRAMAIQALHDLVQQKQNSSVRLAAARELLDREGTFARVTRTGLAGDAQGGFISEVDEEVSDALAATFNS